METTLAHEGVKLFVQLSRCLFQSIQALLELTSYNQRYRSNIWNPVLNWVTPQSNLIKAWLKGSDAIYHKNCMKLINCKDDARISKGKSLYLRDRFHSSQISFLHNNLWVFMSPRKETFKSSILQMPTKVVSDHDLISIPLSLHKNEVNLTINFHPLSHYNNCEIKNNK